MVLSSSLRLLLLAAMCRKKKQTDGNNWASTKECKQHASHRNFSHALHTLVYTTLWLKGLQVECLVKKSLHSQIHGHM